MLTTVNHLSDNVFTLSLADDAGRTEALGVTGTHRFYSLTRGWETVQDLQRPKRCGSDGIMRACDQSSRPWGTPRVTYTGDTIMALVIKVGVTRKVSADFLSRGYTLDIQSEFDPRTLDDTGECPLFRFSCSKRVTSIRSAEN